MLLTTAYDLYRRVYLRYMGRWIGPSLKHMHLPNGPKAYILQSFEESLDDYTVFVETNGDGFVLTFEYNPDKPTPNLADYLQNIKVPSGFLLCHYNGHDGCWLMLHHKSKEEATATYKRIYMDYFRHQIFMCIIKV